MLSNFKKACYSTVPKERKSVDECFAKQRHFLMKWMKFASITDEQRAVNTFSLFCSSEKRWTRRVISLESVDILLWVAFSRTHKHTRRQTKEGEEQEDHLIGPIHKHAHTYVYIYLYLYKGIYTSEQWNSSPSTDRFHLNVTRWLVLVGDMGLVTSETVRPRTSSPSSKLAEEILILFPASHARWLPVLSSGVLVSSCSCFSVLLPSTWLIVPVTAVPLFVWVPAWRWKVCMEKRRFFFRCPGFLLRCGLSFRTVFIFKTCIDVYKRFNSV